MAALTTWGEVTDTVGVDAGRNCGISLLGWEDVRAFIIKGQPKQGGNKRRCVCRVQIPHQMRVSCYFAETKINMFRDRKRNIDRRESTKKDGSKEARKQGRKGQKHKERREQIGRQRDDDDKEEEDEDGQFKNIKYNCLHYQ